VPRSTLEDWWKRIEALIARAESVVFVLSPDAVASEVALHEVAFAASLNKRLAPVVYRHVDDREIPQTLAKLNFVFFDDADHFEASADLLSEALQTDIRWIRRHTEFGEQARRWAAASQPAGLLLRSPVLEQAEQWIASRPAAAPAPTEETQRFIRTSRQRSTQRRNVLTGSLAAGLALALGLASLAYWQRTVAVEQRSIAQQNEIKAKQERDKATRSFQLAHQTADSLVFDIARGLRGVEGMNIITLHKILATARSTFEQLAVSAPEDSSLQESRVVMLIEFGDSYLSLGDLTHAREAYRDSLAISERLAASWPSDALARDNLAVSYSKLGDVLVEEGKLDQALKNYRHSLSIQHQVVQSEPDITEWQSKLAVAHEQIGHVLLTRGKLDEALAAYKESLAIRERLVAREPDNSDGQRRLSIAKQGLGAVLLAQNRLDDALTAYQGSVVILEHLASTDRSNATWQQNLSASYTKLGDVLMAQHRLDDALKAHRDSLAIAQRLAAMDPSDLRQQGGLMASYERVGNVLLAQGNLGEALNIYRNTLAIAQALATADVNNLNWQRALFVAFAKIGKLLIAVGNLDAALRTYKEGLNIAERLVNADPTNITWKRDLAFTHLSLAALYEKKNMMDESREELMRLQQISIEIAAVDNENVQLKNLLGELNHHLSPVQYQAGSAVDADCATKQRYHALMARSAAHLAPVSRMSAVGPLTLRYSP
jgi:tetratricopeptide (TPR) repeat protein